LFTYLYILRGFALENSKLYFSLSLSLSLSLSPLPDDIGFIINTKYAESDEDPSGKREREAGRRFCPMKCDESGN